VRYGNKAFRDWHARVVERAPAYMRQVLGGLHAGAECELVTYLIDSFGNSTRIDYGTGHETTFIVLLCEMGCCLRSLSAPYPSAFLLPHHRLFVQAWRMWISRDASACVASVPGLHVPLPEAATHLLLGCVLVSVGSTRRFVTNALNFLRLAYCRACWLTRRLVT
jgi:hypothetical protein